MIAQQLGRFEALGIQPAILKALDDMGFEEPSPIQQETIPLLLEGKDLIGQAQTGTGKTAAFAVPILQRLQGDGQAAGPAGSQAAGPGGRGSQSLPQALVITPTRELALQVAEEIAKIGRYLDVRELAVYGGSPIQRQIKALQAGVSVVIGTPGRLMDHINRGTLKLGRIRTLVLDEADEMLDMGFIGDIETIMRHLPAERQTVCFSATMPDPILRLAKQYMRNPVRISIGRENLSGPAIEQAYFEVRPAGKVDALTRIIDHEAISRGIVFCRTKRGADELARALQARGYLAEAIHGNLNQVQRNRVLARFRSGHVELLVATDVAARGIDVENLTHVINYDIAQSPEAHVHRIGRTGRAGREGTAFTLVHPREVRQLRMIERATKARIPRRRVPAAEDIAEMAVERLGERIESLVAEGARVDSRYADLASRLLDEHEPERLVTALLAAVGDGRGTGVGAAEAAGSNGAGFGLGANGAARGTAVRRSDGIGYDFPETGAELGYVRLFINIGGRQQLTPADVVRTIAREADIPGKVIGAIDIHENFTFVEVPRDVGGQVLDALQHVSIRGRSINAAPAKPPAAR